MEMGGHMFSVVYHPEAREEATGYVRPHRADLKKSIAQGLRVRLPQ